MSSRHLKALQQGGGLVPGDGPDPHLEQESEEEDDDALLAPVAAKKPAAFELLLDSSEEEEAEESESEASEAEQESEQEEPEQEAPAPKSDDDAKPAAPAPAPAVSRRSSSGDDGVGGAEDDDGFWVLDAAAAGGQQQEQQEQQEQQGQQGGRTRPPNRVRAFFQLDSRALNAENELRTRFGAEEADLQQLPAQRGGGRRRGMGGVGGGPGRAGVMAQLYARRCFLGPPKEDWPKPPTYVGGGMRMVRTEPPKDFDRAAEGADAPRCAWFAFEHSPALEALQQDYTRVQETCDPNALAIFLAHNPHHTEGLVTLALVLATHGMMDRAADNVRRCLFAFEAAYSDGFRSAVLGSSSTSNDDAGLARLDSRRPENRPYFAALFRHLQMVGARGLYQTAYEVGKLLLSLDPTGDPMGVLLCLDFYALRAGRAEQLLLLRDAGLRVGKGWSADDDDDYEGGGAGPEEGEWGVDDDEEEDEDLGLKPLRRAGGRSRRRGRGRRPQEAAEQEGVEEEQEDGEEDGVVTVSALPNVCFSCVLALLQLGRRDEARDALREALLRFPAMLPALVEKCRNELGSRVPQPWAPVTAHPFFGGAADRLGDEAASVLPRVAAVYAQRSYELWGGDPQAMQLLFDVAKEVLVEVEQGSWGYDEEAREQQRHYFPGTPLLKYGRATVADYGDEFPRLPNDVNPLNPALADPVIARRGRLNLNRHQPVWGPNLNAGAGRAGGGLGPARGTLSPDLPLLELFWRTLLPWNTVEGMRRYG